MSRGKGLEKLTGILGATLGALATGGIGYLCIRSSKKTEAERFRNIYVDGITEYLYKKLEREEITREQYKQAVDILSRQMIIDEKNLQATGYKEYVDQTIEKILTKNKFNQTA
jgi:hypothetical protein